MGDQFWSSLDTELIRLVDRLRVASGSQHPLELEFQRNHFFFEIVTEDLDRFLPKFREKGRVIISDASGRIFYCSDGTLGSGLDL